MSSFEQLQKTTKVYAGERKDKWKRRQGPGRRKKGCVVKPSICDGALFFGGGEKENTFSRTKQSHDWNLEIYKNPERDTIRAYLSLDNAI